MAIVTADICEDSLFLAKDGAKASLRPHSDINFGLLICIYLPIFKYTSTKAVRQQFGEAPSEISMFDSSETSKAGYIEKKIIDVSGRPDQPVNIKSTQGCQMSLKADDSSRSCHNSLKASVE